MKKLAIITASLAIAASCFGQGAVIFNNRTTGFVIAPVYGPLASAPNVRLTGMATTNGGSTDYTGARTLLVGTGYSAELWAGSSVGTLAAVQVNGKTTFRTTAVTGFIQALTTGDAQIPGIVAAGTPTVLQLRAWDNALGTVNSWAAVMARPELAQGASDPFTVALSPSPPAPSSAMVGLLSFNLTTNVPEPGVIALGVLGLGALLLRRRK